MEKGKYDLYYRNFPSNVVPIRTPFTRSGCHDVGHVFLYVTNARKRWSLLLDETQAVGIYEEARQRIPDGICQLWLVEKRYSTHKPRSRRPPRSRVCGSAALSRNGPSVKLGYRIRQDQVLIVFKEPSLYDTLQGDVISYHFREADAIAAAETYTRRCNRRAVVGALLWDEILL